MTLNQKLWPLLGLLCLLATDGTPEARLHMADVHYKKGAIEDARRFLDDALKQDNGHCLHVGRVCGKKAG